MDVTLSKRQFAILQMKMEGMQDKQIADKLGIRLRTAKFHAERLFKLMKASRGTIELIGMFGHFEMKPVWVANPQAPRIKIEKHPKGNWR